jgi:hypothetical protein
MRTLLPPWLSSTSEKRVLFGLDPYFRDAWLDIQDLLAADAAEGWLRSSALLVLRPDSIAARVGARILRGASDNGFIPIASLPVRFHRHMVRELWRHDLNGTPPDRLDLLELLMGQTDSLFVLLRDEKPARATTAADRLRQLKGPSRPHHRGPHHLRALADVGEASVLTYLHAADEPIDVVREIGILFGREQRTALVRAVPTGDALEQAMSNLLAIEATVKANDLMVGPATQRVLEWLSGGRDGTMRERLTRGGDWRWLLPFLSESAAGLDAWDVITVAAHACSPRHERPPAYLEAGRQLAALARTG